MEHIISFKVARSFNIGSDINEETTKRYFESVIAALSSDNVLFDDLYEYPIHHLSIISEHQPDGDTFFTYLDFKIPSKDFLDTGPDFKPLTLLEQLIEGLANNQFELVILWTRNFEAHIVFEYKKQ